MKESCDVFREVFQTIIWPLITAAVIRACVGMLNGFSVWLEDQNDSELVATFAKCDAFLLASAKKVLSSNPETSTVLPSGLLAT